MDRFEVRVSITKLLLVLLIVIVPLSIVGYILTIRSDRSLDNAIGNDYKALAQTYSNQVSEYFRDRVADVNAMAADSALVSAVASANRTSGSAKSAATNQPGLRETPSAHASEVLKARRNLDPRFLSIVATDATGDVVASSQQIPKLSYAQDEDWQGAYNKGEGAVKISNILDDELTKSYYVNIDVPIGDPNSGQLIGVLSAAVNISPLLSRFQQDQIGNGARAELVSEDGTVVSGPNADVFARVKSQGYDGIRDSLGSMQGRQAGWQLVGLRNGPYIIGYSATGLKQHFDNLGWAVLVSQDEHQAASPIRQLERFAILMVVLAIFMITLLCVYYFLHRSQKFEDIEQAAGTEPQDRAAAASM